MTGYPVLRLCEVADVVAGDPAPQDPEAFSRNGPLFVRMQDVGRDHHNLALSSSTDRLSTKWLKRNRLRLFPKDSVLIPKSGASVNLNHRAKLATDAYVVSHLAVVTPNRKIIDPEYLFWWFVRYDPRAQAQVTSLPSLKLATLKAAEVQIPPLDKQRRIADILNRAARIERLHAQTAVRLRGFISALFIRMFGTQGALSQDWPVATIEEILASKRGAIRTGPFGSQLKHSEFTDQGVPVLGIDNVATNRFLWAKPRYIPSEKYTNFLRYRVFPGDVIVTIMGTTGRVCVAPDDLPECMSTKHLCVLTLNRSFVEPFFVWGALLFDDCVRAQARVQGQGQIMEGWNLTIVKRLQLRIPPIDVQRQFARIVTQIIAFEKTVAMAGGTASALSASLMADLVGHAA